MFTMEVPKYLCNEVALTTPNLINRIPTRVLKFDTPLKRLLSIFPYIRIFTSLPLKTLGCILFVHIHELNCSKLNPRVEKCVLVRYSPQHKRYNCYNPISKKFVVWMWHFSKTNLTSLKIIFKGRVLGGKILFGSDGTLTYVRVIHRILT